jgi:hypothetical protein
MIRAGRKMIFFRSRTIRERKKTVGERKKIVPFAVDDAAFCRKGRRAESRQDTFASGFSPDHAAILPE